MLKPSSLVLDCVGCYMTFRKKLLLVNGLNYPDGDAGAARQVLFGKIINTAGYEVVAVMCGPRNASDKEGISYHSWRVSEKRSLIGKMCNAFRFVKLCSLLANNCDADWVVLSSGMFSHELNIVKRWARANGVKLIYDAVEWYSPEEFVQGRKASAYRLNDWIISNYIDESFAVISISSYLQHYFENKAIETIRVPILHDSWSTASSQGLVSSTGRLEFVYAGSPAAGGLIKDSLDVVLAGFLLLDDSELELLHIRIVGMSSNQAIDCGFIDEDGLNRLGDSISFEGRVSRERAREFVACADFSILMRHDIRYSKAGFPTKFTESMELGTPMISNLTSDLCLYLKDGWNGFVVNDYSAEAFADSIKRAMAVNGRDLNELSQNAFDTALESLSSEQYASKIVDFIERL